MQIEEKCLITGVECLGHLIKQYNIALDTDALTYRGPDRQAAPTCMRGHRTPALAPELEVSVESTGAEEGVDDIEILPEGMDVTEIVPEGSDVTETVAVGAGPGPAPADAAHTPAVDTEEALDTDALESEERGESQVCVCKGARRPMRRTTNRGIDTAAKCNHFIKYI
ncbi:hypothetical protein EVAR_64471_1 [Eumeta japonica]|uniref:Uncharacterized protein n=1 Tax=Eumeta variegata TaxID=151549 RepID=A0A4C1ZEM8_EUMVA|nr:hypothetical protein EVAR_64471_1 [Eumeta japonica]